MRRARIWGQILIVCQVLNQLVNIFNWMCFANNNNSIVQIADISVLPSQSPDVTNWTVYKLGRILRVINLWKDAVDWVKGFMDLKVEDIKSRGRPMITWKNVADEDMRSLNMNSGENKNYTTELWQTFSLVYCENREFRKDNNFKIYVI